MANSSIPKAFCTTREAAEILGVSVGTVQLWVETGILDAWKTSGGHRRVMRESIRKIIDKTQDSPSPPPVTNANGAPARPRMKILIVEDDVDLLRLYQVQLARWPMTPEVTVAENAFTALMLMGRSHFDLLITDLNMNGMDGTSMLRVVATDPSSTGMRIVVVSGLSAADIQNKGGIPNGIEVLPKPVPFDRLLHIGTEVAQSLVGVS